MTAIRDRSPGASVLPLLHKSPLKRVESEELGRGFDGQWQPTDH